MLSRNDDEVSKKFSKHFNLSSYSQITVKRRCLAVAYFSAWVCSPPPLAGSAGPGPWHSGSDSPTSNVGPGAPPSKRRPCSPKL